MKKLVLWFFSLTFVLLSAISNNVYGVDSAILTYPSNGAHTHDTTPLMRWNAASGATHYTVHVGTDPSLQNPAAPRWIKRDLTSLSYSFNSSFIPNATAGTTPSQLEVGQKYYWRIKSQNRATYETGSFITAFSEIRSFTIKPSTPSITLPSSSSSGSYTMSWSKPPGNINEYQIREIGPSGVVYYTQGSQNKSFSGRAPGTYSYRVKACIDSICSAYSSTKTINVLATPTISSPSQGTVISDDPCFSWTSSSPGSLYNVALSKSPRAWDDQYDHFWVKGSISGTSTCWDNTFWEKTRDPITRVATTVSTTSADTLDSNETYYWHVVAIDGVSIVKSSEANFTVEQTVPNIVSPASGAGEVAANTCFSWTSSSAGALYNVALSKSPRAWDDQYDHFWVKSGISGTSDCWDTTFTEKTRDPVTRVATTVSITSLEALDSKETYYWHVVAIDGSSIVKSTEANFTVEQTAPNIISPTFGAEVAVDTCFSWTSSSESSLYNIALSKSPRAWDDQYDHFWVKSGISGTSDCWDTTFTEKTRDPVTRVATTVSTTSAETLDPNETYYWHVVAIDGGLIFKSVESQFTVNTNILSGLAAEYSAYPHGLKLTWNTFPDTTTYEVARSLDEGMTWDYSYGSATEPEFIDSDIEDTSLTYSYLVRACSATCSNWTANPHEH